MNLKRLPDLDMIPVWTDQSSFETPKIKQFDQCICVKVQLRAVV